MNRKKKGLNMTGYDMMSMEKINQNLEWKSNCVEGKENFRKCWKGLGK